MTPREQQIRELALDHAVRWGYADRIKPGPEGVVAAAEMFAAFLRASEAKPSATSISIPLALDLDGDALIATIRREIRKRDGRD